MNRTPESIPELQPANAEQQQLAMDAVLPELQRLAKRSTYAPSVCAVLCGALIFGNIGTGAIGIATCVIFLIAMLACLALSVSNYRTRKQAREQIEQLQRGEFLAAPVTALGIELNQESGGSSACGYSAVLLDSGRQLTQEYTMSFAYAQEVIRRFGRHPQCRMLLVSSPDGSFRRLAPISRV